jgi:hypothetical protein
MTPGTEALPLSRPERPEAEVAPPAGAPLAASAARSAGDPGRASASVTLDVAAGPHQRGAGQPARPGTKSLSADIPPLT